MLENVGVAAFETLENVGVTAFEMLENVVFRVKSLLEHFDATVCTDWHSRGIEVKKSLKSQDFSDFLMSVAVIAGCLPEPAVSSADLQKYKFQHGGSVRALQEWSCLPHNLPWGCLRH